MPKVYIEKEKVDVIRLRNDTGHTLLGSEFVIIGEFAGVVDRNTEDGEYFGLQIAPFLEIQAGDFIPGDYKAGGIVYFDSDNDKFSDQPGEKRKPVGITGCNYIKEHGYFTFHLYPQAGSTGGGSGGATETDPVYTVDKPLIALKTELPDISGKANKAEVTAVQAEVDGIKPLIPTQASPANQLSDKDFINSSIQNMAARYVTATSAGDTQFESLAALNEGQWFHQGQPYTPTVHDYAIFINTDNSVWRAGFDGAQWNAQYKINDTPFTAAQIAAINSGITSGLVTQMQELISNPPGGGGGQQLYLHKMTLSIIYSSSTSISDELIWINDHPIADFDPTAYDQNTYRLKFLNGMGPVPSGNFIKKLSDIRHGMVSSQYRFIQNISVGIMSNAFFKIIYLSTINASTGSITWSLNDTTAGSNLTLTNETITPFGVD